MTLAESILTITKEDIMVPCWCMGYFDWTYPRITIRTDHKNGYVGSITFPYVLSVPDINNGFDFGGDYHNLEDFAHVWPHIESLCQRIYEKYGEREDNEGEIIEIRNNPLSHHKPHEISLRINLDTETLLIPLYPKQTDFKGELGNSIDTITKEVIIFPCHRVGLFDWGYPEITICTDHRGSYEGTIQVMDLPQIPGYRGSGFRFGEGHHSLEDFANAWPLLQSLCKEVKEEYGEREGKTASPVAIWNEPILQHAPREIYINIAYDIYHPARVQLRQIKVTLA